MPEIFLSPPVTDVLRKLPPGERHRAIDLMRVIQDRPSLPRAKRIYSTLLDTTLYLVQKAGLRMLFEIHDDRAVILTITWRA
jgi:hypothetical protein